MKIKNFSHSFVSVIPDELEENIVYISIKYNTAVHKCACGCGEEVVTPISPLDWKITYNGKSISLSPSIGNWSYKCRSHYWITEDKVVWAGNWTNEQISTAREEDIQRRERSIRPKRKGNFIADFLKKIFQ